MIFLVRFFLVIFFVVVQSGVATQIPKFSPFNPSRAGSVYHQIFRDKFPQQQTSPSTSPTIPVKTVAPQQKFPMLFPVPKGDDGLFLKHMPRPSSSMNQMMEKKGEDLSFDTPVHGQEPSSDDELFYHSLTANSNPMKHIYDRYRITYYPYQREIEKYFDKLKSGIQENPYTCSIYGGIGAGFGAGSGLFWNHLYKKGINLGDKTPAIKENWLFAYLKKGANSPTFQRTLMTKASGKFCLVGLGFAVASGLSDHEDFSSTLKPTLSHIRNDIGTALSYIEDKLANAVLSIGNELDYSPDGSTVQRK